MKICHLTMFAPARCGLYEASRDMYLADKAYGHDVDIIDVGKVSNGKLIEEPKIGSIDNRGTKIISSSPEEINNTDLIIMHTGCNDNWIVKTTAPVIFVVHGRPLACFRPESNGLTQAFTLYENVSKWQRVKKMLYFWSEFKPNWGMLFNGKDLVIDYPVIDQARFKTLCNNDFDFVSKGKYNFVITDSNREDICTYEMITSIINAVKSDVLKDLDIKFHFYGLDFPLKNNWNILLGKLKETGKLGDLHNRVLNLEKVYNKADCLISPNSIIVRTIAEAICCDCFVIAENCNVADINIKMNNYHEMIYAISNIVNSIDNNRLPIQTYKQCFSFENYNKVINKAYKEVI